MTTLLDVAVLLAQAQAPTPTATPLSVELINDEGTPWWQPFVIPLATLVAALGGVVIGGKINRDTMRSLEDERAERDDKRDEERARREDTREKERGERDDARDEAKTKRELAGEQRQALASLRIIIHDIRLAAIDRRVEGQAEGDTPVIPVDEASPLQVRAEDKHHVAAWVSDDTWRTISATLSRIEFLHWVRSGAQQRVEAGTFDADDFRAGAMKDADDYEKIIKDLGAEVDRLRSVE